jgi:hypothetical protein
MSLDVKFIVFTLILTASMLAQAWDTENIRGPEAQQAKAEFMRQIELTCQSAGCTIRRIDGKFTPDFLITLRNGWWFKVTHDPGVIEVTTKPSTLAELNENK